ncbi:MAG: hypothetical protein QNJ31_08375 [Candidatus Caenarcaniphilales bacterium]|nr:hypothetical protein [Candidatus Caenarcaniphilales bacterium]
MSDDKNRENNQPEFSFEDEPSEHFDPLDTKWEDNPFEKSGQEFQEKLKQTEYLINNESLEISRSQSKGFAKVLLVLLLGVGILIAAVFGLLNNENKTNQAVQVPSTKEAVLPERELVKPNSVKQKRVSLPFETKDYCKLSQAQKYIANDVNDLDRVLTLLEREIKNSDKENIQVGKIDFFKSKIEDLSRAENDIRAFSSPYLEKDLGISFLSKNSNMCKVQDGSKYLQSWIDDIKGRINSLESELGYLKKKSTGSTIATRSIERKIQEKSLKSKLDKPKKPIKKASKKVVKQKISKKKAKPKIKSSSSVKKKVNKKQKLVSKKTLEKKPKASKVVNNKVNNKKTITQTAKGKDLNKKKVNKKILSKSLPKQTLKRPSSKKINKTSKNKTIKNETLKAAKVNKDLNKRNTLLVKENSKARKNRVASGAFSPSDNTKKLAVTPYVDGNSSLSLKNNNLQDNSKYDYYANEEFVDNYDASYDVPYYPRRSNDYNSEEYYYEDCSSYYESEDSYECDCSYDE